MSIMRTKIPANIPANILRRVLITLCGTIVDLVGMSERSGRNVLKALLDEGMLVASTDWHRSTVRLGFPPHAAGYWFPNLFPAVLSD